MRGRLLYCNGQGFVLQCRLLSRVLQEVKPLPNIKSAKKRVKVAEKKNLQNRIVKTKMRNSVKRFQLAAAGDGTETEALYRAAVSAVDKAASKGVIHKNASNRKKAQLAKALNTAKA